MPIASSLMDASGVETVANLVARLKASGITLTFSGPKQQVMEVMEKTGLTRKTGAGNIFATDMLARAGYAAATVGNFVYASIAYIASRRVARNCHLT